MYFNVAKSCYFKRLSINISIIIIAKFYTRAWSWLHASTIYLVPFSNPSGGQYSMKQDRSPRHGSRLFWGVLFVFSIRPRFSYCRQQSSPTIILCGKLWQRDRINITGLNEWCRHTQKTIGLESHLVVQFSVPFLNSVPFSKYSKVPTEK